MSNDSWEFTTLILHRNYGSDGLGESREMTRCLLEGWEPFQAVLEDPSFIRYRIFLKRKINKAVTS